MKLAIMQPYFFPYLGYFDLINRADQFIAFDSVKYSPKTWMNRNRVLHPKSGWQYISVPINKYVKSGRLCEVLVIDLKETEKKIINQLAHYRKNRAPYFENTLELLKNAFKQQAPCRLVDLNMESLKCVCSYLEIPFRHKTLTSMSLNLPEITHPGRWALEISSACKAVEYINLPSGKSIFQADEWQSRGIKIRFTELINFSYQPSVYKFINHLSIIDVLMWNNKNQIKAFLDSIKEKYKN